MLARKKPTFESREEAGCKLAKHLVKFTGMRDAIVLALPNGGVPVGTKIAGILGIPFDVMFVGQITGPNGEKLGAITCGGVRMLDSAMIDRLHLSDVDIKDAVLKESIELAKKERLFHGQKPSLDVADRTVILVDDGTTPCMTVRNAIRLLRRQHAERIIVALPIGCRHAACDLRHEACEVITLAEPEYPARAGKWPSGLPDTPESGVCDLLSAGNAVVGTHN